MTLNQAYLFYIFILTGIILGLIFDIFRILRRSFKTTDFITYIQDTIFWIIASIILLYTIFKFNQGEIRIYVFLGIGLGLTGYLILFSKTFIKINVSIILWIKKIFKYIISIILYPIKILFNLFRKILLKPISFVFINIRKNITDIFKKMSKIKFQPKIFKKKLKKKQ